MKNKLPGGAILDLFLLGTMICTSLDPGVVGGGAVVKGAFSKLKLPTACTEKKRIEKKRNKIK